MKVILEHGDVFKYKPRGPYKVDIGFGLILNEGVFLIEGTLTDTSIHWEGRMGQLPTGAEPVDRKTLELFPEVCLALDSGKIVLGIK